MMGTNYYFEWEDQKHEWEGTQYTPVGELTHERLFIGRAEPGKRFLWRGRRAGKPGELDDISFGSAAQLIWFMRPREENPVSKGFVIDDDGNKFTVAELLETVGQSRGYDNRPTNPDPFRVAVDIQWQRDDIAFYDFE
jgi:hypothetical protein